MRVTIIAEENRVFVEGMPEKIDCSALYESGVHVVQWYGDNGEVEYFNEGVPPFKPNEQFIDFAPYQQYLDAWEVAARVA